MDAKTFDYMNEKVKKYNELQRQILAIKDSLKYIDTDKPINSVYFTIPNSNYINVPHVDREVLKSTLIKLMNDKIAALEKEQFEI